MLDIISNLLGAVKEFFGYKREDANRHNTPEMQRNAKAEADTKTVDESRKTVLESDIEQLRRDIS